MKKINMPVTTPANDSTRFDPCRAMNIKILKKDCETKFFDIYIILKLYTRTRVHDSCKICVCVTFADMYS